MKKKTGKLWFTSDTHFGHSNIVKYCHRPFLCDVDKQKLEELGGKWHNGVWKGGDVKDWKISYDSVKIMDDYLINRINECVAENDVLWHLGDFAFAPKHKYAYVCRKYRERINCKDVKIIWGNHDNGHLISDLFTENYKLHEIRVPSRTGNIVLCHYAMAVFNKSHRGNMHLYGHSHQGAENWMDRHMPDRRSMDVGVDNAKVLLGDYRPFSLDEIVSFLNSKKGHFMDHHVGKDALEEKFLIG